MTNDESTPMITIPEHDLEFLIQVAEEYLSGIPKEVHLPVAAEVFVSRAACLADRYRNVSSDR